MLLLLMLPILLLGGCRGGGDYGHSRWLSGGGAGLGLGTFFGLLLNVFILGSIR